MHHQPRFYDHICKKYGDVFLSLDRDIRHDLSLFVNWSQSHPLAKSLLDQGHLPQSLAKKILSMFCQKHAIHTLSKAALHILQSHHRLSYASLILSYMNMKKENIVNVFVHSAQKLSEQGIKRIASVIENVTQKKPRIQCTTDPRLFMGTVVIWNCSMIDASLQKLIQCISQEKF